MIEVRDRLAFYAERDRRANEYDDGVEAIVERPIGIVVEQDVANSRSGQVAVLALVNMLSRLHRDIALAIPEAPLRASALVAGSDLRQVALATAMEIAPLGRFSLIQPGHMRGRTTIGVGSPTSSICDVSIGWNGQMATLGRESQPAAPDDSSILGAALASCLGAAAILMLVTGAEIANCATSLVDFRHGPDATPGGERLEPLDVGDVLLVGAGAVGSALCYWLRELGVSGHWVVIDRDDLLLHNTNRTIGSLVGQTEWAGRKPTAKARAAAELIGAEWHRSWYHEYRADHPETRPALIIPAANEYDVRELVGMARPQIVHATTSPDWAAELHRHVAGVDECIACRFPSGVANARFACSTGPLVEGPSSGDAALPFMSAAAGLLLLRGLQLHAQGGLAALDANFIRLGLGSFRPVIGSFSRFAAPPRDGCQHLPQAFLTTSNGGTSTD